jgi:uncharacterized protein (TIGR04255 family)
MEPTRLANAPINEALAHFQFDRPDGVDIESLKSFAKLVADRYPVSQQRFAISGELRLALGNDTTFVNQNTAADGLVLWAPERQRALQCRFDGFTVSWLKPYDTWQAFIDEIHAMWALYAETLKPVVVRRVGLRYINQISIPLPINDLADYFHTRPLLGSSLPQALADFLLRTTMHDPASPALVALTQVAIGVTADEAQFVFDIDAFRDLACASDSAELWTSFEQLRVLKNKVFFGSLTDKALEKYQ